MSVGHRHSRVHHKTLAQLHRLLTEPATALMMKRPAKTLFVFDVPDTGGYSVDGLERYLDRTFFAMLYSGEITVPGMHGAQIMRAILFHEQTEKAILDADNDIDDYDDAHEFATVAEHTLVPNPKLYEDGIKQALEQVRIRILHNPPPNLACAPYLDNPDWHDRESLRQLRFHGVRDAFKASKPDLDYGKGHPNSKCSICRHYQPLPGQPRLASCAVAEGTVHPEDWCKRFELAPQTAVGNPKIEEAA